MNARDPRPETAMPTPPICRLGDRPDDLIGRAVLVDKPAGWTSFDVVKKIRVLTDISKVGHAGSLDPQATGLLICCVGRPATREVEQFMDLDKSYEGVLRLGEVTPSYDAETEVVERRPIEGITDAKIRTALEQFTGTIRQKPPMYSAVKVRGEPLYKRARRGEEVERPVREVRVDRYEMIEREGADVQFEVDCSKGTYVRSLVHDLGRTLGPGAHLTDLRRTAIGPYRVEEAFSIERLEELVGNYKSSDGESS